MVISAIIISFYLFIVLSICLFYVNKSSKYGTMLPEAFLSYMDILYSKNMKKNEDQMIQKEKIHPW
jgi:hypothetical protein